jgi:NAD(P)-dependent dehydrogenase (short-subunit alcohol dehydrogenase family)
LLTANQYSASKHAIEGLSETLDHEVRNFGIRVVLVQPAYTKTNLDGDAPHTYTKVSAYDSERDVVVRAVAANVSNAQAPEHVALTIVEASLGPWKMRRTPKG